MTMGHAPDESLELANVKFGWGNAAKAKAEHRAEAQRRYQARSLSERLAETLALMSREPGRERSGK
jgi:hypothetical protein